MTSPNPIEYSDASIEVRKIYDEIKQARGVNDVNNFWKYLANDPVTLRRTWHSLKEIMGPGALDSNQRVDLHRSECDQQLCLLYPLTHCIGEFKGHDRCDVRGINGGGGNGE